jgi:transcriptional regulator with XRE-family HTH domain
MSKFSFKKGFGQVQQKDVPAVRNELMKALGVSSRMSLSKYMRGLTEPKITQVQAVEKVFHRYGITDIWGEE